MTKSHKQFGSRSASPLLCKDRASIRVGDLQLIFKDLLSAWKDSRSGDAALLEERMHLMLREWQAELNQTSPATSLQNDSGGSLSSAICRLFQLYKDEDATSIAKEKVSAETGDTAIILCHWNGYICEGPEGIDYSEGVSQLIRVRSQVSYTELLDRIYSITEWDIASTQVNITGRLCTHTNPTHFIGTPICNDEALSALLEMYGARKVYCVELYLNSPRLDSMTNEIPPVAEQSTVSSQASYCPNREGQNESGVDSQPYPEIARLFAEHHNQSTSSLFDYRFTSVDSKFLENCEDTLGINIDELSSAKSHSLPLQTEETRVRVHSEPSSSGPSHPPGFPRVIVEITQPCTGPSCPSTTKQDADGNAQKRARRDDSASEDDHKTPKLF